ncbi:hypothetical protein [Nocardia grenadensis]
MHSVLAGDHVVTQHLSRCVERRAALVERVIIAKDSIGEVRVAHHDSGPGPIRICMSSLPSFVGDDRNASGSLGNVTA